MSFFSVTQLFNTTNSMGRLTLNMLLSFAQFEREVTAERIRDKIISFAVVAYIALFYSAAKVREVVPAALVTLWLTAAGLAHVNLSDALSGLEGEKSMTAYWAQTALIGGFAIGLTALYLRAHRGMSDVRKP